ncbi:hypothetical protein CSC81_14620 [Tenacibaculum discolor]|uniref:Non-ribosomal peptide synthetase n=1 Tax=Tenacibaculum discolor TaxID=361581 RepID=A0A2G1BQS3_9FLAO|nr:non-ribosomal peptide synthetase [Tenacibaculum discolor]MDP2542683.1 non-ribosomal peptide synthetase [Tenacibaculum discolor]PHN96377.1 hypothetical protein CSC81_14620 [Tenacibaculum discolor]
METVKKIISELREEKIHLKLNSDDTIEIASYDKGLTPELIEKIKTNKEILVTFLKSKSSGFSKIQKLSETEKYELSSAQMRLWVIDRFEGKTSAFNMPFHMPLKEKIDITSFNKAILSVIERHEILRTVFQEDEDGKVWQKIIPVQGLNFSVDYKDFRGSGSPQKEVEDYIKNDSILPFDLEKGPLLRISLLQTSDEYFELYYNMHHIISDGWSLLVLSKDVLAFYNSYKNNVKAELEPLEIQYKDYAAWQLDKLSNDETEKAKTYWLNKLSGDIPILDLPTDKDRPKSKTYKGNSLEAYISPKVTGEIKEITQKQGGSLFMGIVAALKILLYKYTSEKDITIGTPVHGRDRTELENQIGFYLNILPLRNQVIPDETFEEFLDRIKQTTLEAYKYQAYPFDRLVQDLNVSYDMSRSPIFDISVTYNNITSNLDTVSESELDEIKVLGDSQCKNDLELHFQEVDGCISFGVNYNSDVYEQDIIMNFMNHFKNILSNISNNPSIKTKDVEYLSKNETEKLLSAFNSNEIDVDTSKTVLTLFSEFSSVNPDKRAIQFKDKSLSYKELDLASNKVANFLKEEFNIKPNDIVGIQLDRNEWMIIAILGVMKSGAAYVPINPMLPTSRKKHIVKETNSKVLITEANYIFDLDFFDGNVFAIDVEFDSLENDEAIVEENSDSDLAYVIYTSGSTGDPKGVMVSHGSLLNSIISRNEFYTSIDSILAITPFSFDASIGLYWNALTTGAVYHILDEGSLKNPDFIVKYLIENRIKCLCNPPSLYQLIIKEESYTNINLERVILGGEVIHTNLVDKHFEIIPECRMFNEYGPSENTIWTTVKEITKGGSVNIGKPIHNNYIYILDKEKKLIPIKGKGEIYVGGQNLAKGYINNTKLTEEKFIENPFRKGELMYRTGDFGKWTKNGEIEFIGREDNQVKVRGFRVELGEIERELQKKEEINESKVLVYKNNVNQNELIAYFVGEKDQSLKELKEFLLEKLPEYMIPDKYVKLDKFPLTRNGKIDSKKLLELKGNLILSGVEYIAPETEKEKLLEEVIKNILGVEKVSMEDDFFFLGGNSLKLIELISKLKQLGFNLNIAEVVKKPKVKQIASLLEEVVFEENII